MSASMPESITKYRELVDKGMREVAAGGEGKLKEMVDYHLGYDGDSGGNLEGKAVRSTLCLFTTEALGEEPEKALPAAVSLELVHNFSLVHDDIQDDADVRRGKESVRKMWGEDQAINVGDGLKDLSLLAFSRFDDSGISAEIRLRSITEISKRSLRMIDGQVKDLLYSERENVGVSEYLEMVGQKTCALLEASFYLGGLYAGAEDKLENLDLLGEHLGYLYQIRDDWLGIWGEPERSGKSAKTDLVEKKKTYPVVYALENAEGNSSEKLEEIYSSGQRMGKERIATVREILEEAGGKAGTEKLAEKHWRKAEGIIDDLDLPEREERKLERFGKFLLHREK